MDVGDVIRLTVSGRGNDFNPVQAVAAALDPSLSGRYDINAFIEFRYNGSLIRQPIGNAPFEASGLLIDTSEKTAQRNVTVSGFAVPGSEITVFSNGVEVGQTRPLDVEAFLRSQQAVLVFNSFDIRRCPYSAGHNVVVREAAVNVRC